MTLEDEFVLYGENFASEGITNIIFYKRRDYMNGKLQYPHLGFNKKERKKESPVV